jgi:septal ring factor EnvC (AmiA/AmiB activator)
MNTNINKMDNNMNAILSIIMIALGFINGMIAATLLDKFDNEKLYRKNQRLLLSLESLEETVDDIQEEAQQIEKLTLQIHSLDEMINYMKEDAVRMAAKNTEILNQLNKFIAEQDNLPAPQGPLERSRLYSSDSEDEEFNPPISPVPVQNNKD